MKHAYLIMAHNQWDLLQEILLALDDPRNDIYLHIDRKANVPPNIGGVCQKSNIYFTKRYNIPWAGTRMMKCTLSMLEEASKENYDYYHLISGVDYPIKSQSYIHEYFEAHPNREYVGIDWNGTKSGKFLYRVQYYRFFSNLLGKPENRNSLLNIIAKIEDISIGLQNRLKINRVNYSFYKGSSWFSISDALVKRILLEKEAIEHRYRLTLTPDECWLQTFLLNSEFFNNLAESNLRYIKWSEGRYSPKTLTMSDFSDLIDSNALFARKFDWDRDHEVIMKLKEHISEE